MVLIIVPPVSSFGYQDVSEAALTPRHAGQPSRGAINIVEAQFSGAVKRSPRHHFGANMGKLRLLWNAIEKYLYVER